MSVLADLLSAAKGSLEGLEDGRKESNAWKYKISEAGMGALAVFVMQEPSFLSYQKRLARGTSSHNFHTLFGFPRIPSTPQIKNILDDSAPVGLEPLYHNGLRRLEKEEALKPFKCLGGHLIALDGTQSHSSNKICCESCLSKVHANGSTTYYHMVLCATIVAPGIKEAIPLTPEFIVPQDGHDKQDCEPVALKRWLAKHKEEYRHLNPSILGDDMFSRQPTCEAVIEAGYNFIFTCKESSHKTLYEYLDGAELEQVKVGAKNGYKKCIYEYRFINNVPIRDGKDAMDVNWLEIIEKSAKTGKVLYRNTFVTNHTITAKNVHEIAQAGRARWHLENENNNTLKTKGYRFEHNYGHGKKHLGNILSSLAIIAFLYHTVMNLVDKLYLAARQAVGSRKDFFDQLRAFTSILVFASWESLMKFMLHPPDDGLGVGVL